MLMVMQIIIKLFNLHRKSHLRVIKYLIFYSINRDKYIFQATINNCNFQITNYLIYKGIMVDYIRTSIFHDKDINLYFLDFLSIGELGKFRILSKTSLYIFQQSKYQKEFTLYPKKYKTLDVYNICEGGYINLLKLYIRKYSFSGSYDFEIQIAAKNGHLDIIKYLICLGIDITKNNLAFHSAVKNNHLCVIKLFAFLKANLNDYDIGYDICKYINSRTIAYLFQMNTLFRRNYNLFYACGCGHLKVIKYINRNSKLISDFFLHANSAVNYASRKGYLKVIKYLIFYIGTNSEIIIPFKLAARDNKLDIIKYLDIIGNNETYYRNAFYLALENGHTKIINYLHLQNISIKITNEHRIQCMGKTGSLEDIKLLILQDKNINIDKICICNVAAIYGHLKIIKYIIYLTNNNINKNCTLKNAARNGHLDIVKYLTVQNGDDKYQDECAIYWATKKGHLEIVKYLTSQNTLLDKVIVTVAAKRNYCQLVKYLTFHDLNIRTNNDDPIYEAIMRCNIEIVKYLALHGGNINVT